MSLCVIDILLKVITYYILLVIGCYRIYLYIGKPANTMNQSDACGKLRNVNALLFFNKNLRILCE